MGGGRRSDPSSAIPARYTIKGELGEIASDGRTHGLQSKSNESPGSSDSDNRVMNREALHDVCICLPLLSFGLEGFFYLKNRLLFSKDVVLYGYTALRGGF